MSVVVALRCPFPGERLLYDQVHKSDKVPALLVPMIGLSLELITERRRGNELSEECLFQSVEGQGLLPGSVLFREVFAQLVLSVFKNIQIDHRTDAFQGLSFRESRTLAHEFYEVGFGLRLQAIEE